MRRTLAAALALACAACATTAPPAPAADRPLVSAATAQLPEAAAQGSLLFGRALGATHVRYGTRELRIDDQGRFVLGVGREQEGSIELRIEWPDGRATTSSVRIVSKGSTKYPKGRVVVLPALHAAVGVEDGTA
mgnify:CR=1 FL=1